MIIKIVDNPLEKPKLRTIDYKAGKDLNYYLRGIKTEDKRIIVSGKVVDNFKYIPKKSDEIIVATKVHAPVVAVIIAIAQAAIAAAALHPFLAAAFILATAYSVYSFLSAPRAPSFNSGAGIDSNSPTYTWDGGRTIQEVGTPVPIIYGIHKCWGNIINQYQTSNGDKNYIHLLLLLCEGEICGLTDVKVNDIAIEEYQEATYEERLGTIDQDPIAGFSELHSLNDLNVKLQPEQAIIYQTKLTDIEAFEIYFSFPLGLYQTEQQTIALPLLAGPLVRV